VLVLEQGGAHKIILRQLGRLSPAVQRRRGSGRLDLMTFRFQGTELHALSRQDAGRWLTWARIAHDQALRANPTGRPHRIKGMSTKNTRMNGRRVCLGAWSNPGCSIRTERLLFRRIPRSTCVHRSPPEQVRRRVRTPWRPRPSSRIHSCCQHSVSSWPTLSALTPVVRNHVAPAACITIVTASSALVTPSRRRGEDLMSDQMDGSWVQAGKVHCGRNTYGSRLPCHDLEHGRK
jgi:hypothetical protein